MKHRQRPRQLIAEKTGERRRSQPAKYKDITVAHLLRKCRVGMDRRVVGSKLAKDFNISPIESSPRRCAHAECKILKPIKLARQRATHPLIPFFSINVTISPTLRKFASSSVVSSMPNCCSISTINVM